MHVGNDVWFSTMVGIDVWFSTPVGYLAWFSTSVCLAHILATWRWHLFCVCFPTWTHCSLALLCPYSCLFCAGLASRTLRKVCAKEARQHPATMHGQRLLDKRSAGRPSVGLSRLGFYPTWWARAREWRALPVQWDPLSVADQHNYAQLGAKIQHKHPSVLSSRGLLDAFGQPCPPVLAAFGDLRSWSALQGRASPKSGTRDLLGLGKEMADMGSAGLVSEYRLKNRIQSHCPQGRLS